MHGDDGNERGGHTNSKQGEGDEDERFRPVYADRTYYTMGVSCIITLRRGCLYKDCELNGGVFQAE